MRVTVTNFQGGTQCALRLFDPTNGQELDYEPATKPHHDTVVLDPLSRSRVYLFDDNCDVRVASS